MKPGILEGFEIATVYRILSHYDLPPEYVQKARALLEAMRIEHDKVPDISAREMLDYLIGKYLP